MIDRSALAALIVLLGAGPGRAQGEGPGARPDTSSIRQVEASGPAVLVELYTSQGCNYCPTAERLLREMAEKGYGRDRVVPLAFHVDYFNTPWADPFSSQPYSGRQWAYNQAFKKLDPKSPDLYFTPMVMVDGRYPMSGYHADGTGPVWPPLKARLDRALAARRDVGLTLSLAPDTASPARQILTLRARPKSARLVGRELLACAVITEGPLSTAVPSGENAGATLVEDNVVRRFQFEPVTIRRDGPAETTFTLELGKGWDPSRCHVVAFLQDQETGAIQQLATMPWAGPPAAGTPGDGREGVPGIPSAASRRAR